MPDPLGHGRTSIADALESEMAVGIQSGIATELGEWVVADRRCMTGRDSQSTIDQTRSVNPAAIAGLRTCHRPFSSLVFGVRTPQQKLYESIVKDVTTS